MRWSFQKVPICKAPGEILIFPLGPFFILVHHFGSSPFLVGTIKGLPSLTLDGRGEGRV